MADKDEGTGTGRRTAGRRENPGGSTAPMRADVLAALAVVKVATGRQLYAMVRPDADSDKAVRAALNDLEKLKLVHSEGKTTQPQPPKDAADFAKTVAERAAAAEAGAAKKPPRSFKLWGLTAAGGTAAGQLLPDGREVGNLARGVFPGRLIGVAYGRSRHRQRILSRCPGLLCVARLTPIAAKARGQLGSFKPKGAPEHSRGAIGRDRSGDASTRPLWQRSMG